MAQSEQWPQNVWPENRAAQPAAGAGAAPAADGAPDPASAAYVAPGWQPAAGPAAPAPAAAGAGAWQGVPYGQPAYAAAAPVPPARPRSRAWIVALVAVILLFVTIFAGMASCSSILGSSIGGVSAAPSVASGPTVGIIDIDGTIDYDGSTSSPEGLKAQLDRAEADPDIKAVVLRVNSGGGTATAGEEMSIYVREFSKPVVVSSASLNASAAYEISSQADYIFTAKTTAIGAIGTAMQLTDISGLLDKLGITVDNVTSSESKDSSYGTRPLSEDERAYYQAMVDQINATFIASVAEGRGMTEEEVAKLATGLTFTGMDAVENGLADEIGTLEDACDKAASLAGVASGYYTMYLQPETSDLSALLGLMGMEAKVADDGLTAKEQNPDVRFEN